MDSRSLVALLALGVGAFYVLRALFLGWAEWTRQGIVYRSSAVAAERLLARYLAADYLFHARRRSASLIEPMRARLTLLTNWSRDPQSTSWRKR